MFRKLLLLVSMLLLFSIALVACQPEAAAPSVEEPEAAPEVVEEEPAAEEEVAEEEMEEEPAAEEEMAEEEMEESAESGGGELIVAITTFPNSLTPPNAAERQAINVSQQMFDGLVWRNEEGEISPALATSWEISDDGTEYTFTLREGVVFHNGETFDAQDVVTTIEAGQDPINAYAYYYDETAIVDAEIIDDFTIKLTTANPDPLFLSTGFPSFGMYPTDYFNEVGTDGFEENPIGTGPFKFVEWVKGERIVMEKFEDYWDEGLPLLDRIVFRPIPESPQG